MGKGRPDAKAATSLAVENAAGASGAGSTLAQAPLVVNSWRIATSSSSGMNPFGPFSPW